MAEEDAAYETSEGEPLAGPLAASGMENESAEGEEEVSEGERRLVSSWCSRIKESREHHEHVFRQMRKNQEFARVGATKEWAASGKYVVPILARHINQSVSVLYARNPRTIAERRRKLMYKLWDGRADTLEAAGPLAMMGEPEATAIITEVQQVRQAEAMQEKMGKTLEILWEYFLDEQSVNYKQQLKAAVRRAKVCKVAYVKLGYKRILEPSLSGQIDDITSKMEAIQATMAKVAEESGEGGEVTDEELEQLKLNLADIYNQKDLVVREGPVLSFPRADQIIIDKQCTQLRSFANADFVAEEFEMTPDEISGKWRIDIGSDFTQYADDGNPYDKSPQECKARVYEIWDRVNQQRSVVVEGYSRFVEKPATPEPWTERFWPYFPIVFNEIEHYKEIYPQSDVEHGQHVQNEYNRSREALRQHRIAARPYYVTAQGLESAERDKLSNHVDHEVIEMPSLGANQKVDDLIQRGPVANIDPNLYQVEMIFQDLLRAVGTQEANIGGVSGHTATESSIAEQSRSASLSDNVDDLDEVLTDLARTASQIMLLNLTKDTVMEIVGPGAIWPDMPSTREQIAKELFLKIEAGSSGRPNRSAELANMERAIPYLIQIPGIRPEPLGKRYSELLDLDIKELFAEGLPSITAMNAMMAKAGAGGAGTGNGKTDPNQQGDKGSQNSQNPQSNEPGSQPGYTAPMPGG